MATPQQPDNRENSFDKLSKSLNDFIKSSESRQKISDARVEKLFKEMLVYFKLLEKAVNKDTLFSKKGRESELNEDKGFLKLLELMTDIDDSFRGVINKYIEGNKLVAKEKADLAKFIQRFQDSLLSSNEKIGISLEDLMSSFKVMLSDNKMSSEFRLDILKFLKDYSEEDIALTEDLKNLIQQSINKNEISDENLVKILTEIDNTFDGYLKKEKNATFAPFQKISKQLSGATFALEDIVGVLTKGQRDKEEDKKGGFKDRVKQSITGSIASAGGDVANLLVRNAAIQMSKIPMMKKVAPWAAGASGAVGGLTSMYLSSRGLANIVGDVKNVGRVGMRAGKVLPYVGEITALATSVHDYAKGFKGNNLTERATGGASQMIEGLSFGMVKKEKAGKFYEDFRTKRDEGITNLTRFIGEQNKKIFGNSLDLGQLLTNFVTNPFKNLRRGASDLQTQAQNAVENFKANDYTKGVKSLKKGLTGSEDTRLRDIPSNLITKGGNALTKGLQSFGSYVGGGSWSSKRGSTKQGELVSMDALGLNRQKFQNDKPLVQKDFGMALKSAQDEIKKIYGDKAGFNISGGMSGIDPKTGKLSHASKQHKVGTAVDIGSASGLTTAQAIAILAKHGITRPNAEGDPIHFEYTGIPKSKTGIASKPNETKVMAKPQPVPRIPPTKSKSNREPTQQAQNITVVNQQPQQQAERKIKSDNDLINFTNSYGVL